MYDKPITLSTHKHLGYAYFMDKEHPLAERNGKVFYHRHVASLKIGRWLLKGESVHHLDGDRGNNDTNNLVVISSKSVHARLHAIERDNYRGPIPECICSRCGEVFVPKERKSTKYCSRECFQLAQRRFDISKEELERLVWGKPTTCIAKDLGVSDVAIAKRCRRLGIKKPKRGYWTKKSKGSITQPGRVPDF